MCGSRAYGRLIFAVLLPQLISIVAGLLCLTPAFADFTGQVVGIT
jgi:hypothetical protein